MENDSNKAEEFTFQEGLDRQAYLDHRKQLIELATGQLNTFDKSITVLSTGALGLSLVFVSTFLQGKKPLQIDFLAAAWGLYVLCLIANLFSYKTSWHNCIVAVENLDRLYTENDLSSQKRNFWRTATQWLNYTALLFFVGATALLFYFAYSNLIGN